MLTPEEESFYQHQIGSLDQKWKWMQGVINDNHEQVRETIEACRPGTSELFLEQVTSSPGHRDLYQNMIILVISECENRRLAALREEDAME